MLHPEKFVQLGIDPPKGVLCYGPPGALALIATLLTAAALSAVPTRHSLECISSQPCIACVQTGPCHMTWGSWPMSYLHMIWRPGAAPEQS